MPYTPPNYYSILTQLHPQHILGGDFSSNQGIIAGMLTPYDGTVNYVMDACNPAALDYDSTGQFMSNYADCFVPYFTPGDENNPTYVANYNTFYATKFANKGTSRMLPYYTTRSTLDGTTYWTMLSPVGSESSTLFGWTVRLYENTSPLFYAGVNPWDGTKPHPQLYATPLAGPDGTYGVYEDYNQWIVNVQLIPSSQHISQDALENYIINNNPAWVRFDFYNYTNTSNFPGSSMYGGSNTPHWNLPGSGIPYSKYDAS